MRTVWSQVAMCRVWGFWHSRQSWPAAEFIALRGKNGSWVARCLAEFELLGFFKVNLGFSGFALILERPSQVVVRRRQAGMDAERLREMCFGGDRVVQGDQDNPEVGVKIEIAGFCF